MSVTLIHRRFWHTSQTKANVMDIETQLLKGSEIVAFRVQNSCQQFQDYGHIVVDILYVKDQLKTYDSMGFYDNYHSQKHQYKGLQVKAQMDKHNGAPYGYELTVNPMRDELTLQHAESMVKVLRPIKRKLEKISQMEGYPSDYMEFMMRLVRVLKVRAFYTRENNIQFKLNMNIGRLRDYLAKSIDENNNKLGYQQVA